MTSRARNTLGSRGLLYNGIASVFSNGVWFCSQFYIVNMLVNAKDQPVKFVGTLVFYITFTVAGSVWMHWYLLRFEKQRGLTHG
jgi:hypothetical protein